MYYIVTLGEFQSTAWCTWILTFHYGWTNGFFNHGMPAITWALLIMHMPQHSLLYNYVLCIVVLKIIKTRKCTQCCNTMKLTSFIHGKQVPFLWWAPFPGPAPVSSFWIMRFLCLLMVSSSSLLRESDSEMTCLRLSENSKIYAHHKTNKLQIFDSKSS